MAAALRSSSPHSSASPSVAQAALGEWRRSAYRALPNQQDAHAPPREATPIPDAGARAGDAEESHELRRADTASIIGDFQGAGAGVIAAGLLLAAVYSAIAAVMIWYSAQVPRTCKVGLSTTFRLMGSLDGVLGVLLVCLFLAAKGLVDATGHGVLVEKYESEGRTEEAERQKEELAKKMASAILQGCFPTLGFLLLQAFLLGTWIYGIVQAADAEVAQCGSAVTVFWVMLGVNIVSGLFTGGLELSRAAWRRPGGFVPDIASIASVETSEAGDRLVHVRISPLSRPLPHVVARA